MLNLTEAPRSLKELGIQKYMYGESQFITQYAQCSLLIPAQLS